MPPANTTAITATTISSTAYNTLETDIGTELTNSLDRLGRSAMQANLPMGANKITGMADPTVSTDGATKNYVDTTTSSFFSTGDIKFTIKVAADTGWVLFDDGTIGSASSGASSRANADTQALFTLIFNNVTDAFAPILTSGGGATTRSAQTSASAAWAANCRISLTKTLGRVLGIAGAGSGLTSHTLGTFLGEEAHLLTATEIPAISSIGTSLINFAKSIALYLSPAGTSTSNTGTANSVYDTGGVSNISFATTASGTSNVTSNNTGGLSHNNMQPTVFLNAMVKL